MKKILIILGIVFALLVAVLIIYFGYFFIFVQPAINKDSQQWVDQTIPKIVENWNVSELLNDGSTQFLTMTPKDEVGQFFSTISPELGAFKKYDGSTGEAGIEIHNGIKSTTAEYAAKAEYAKGSIQINIRAIKENGEWKILEFHVGNIGQ